MKRLALGLFAAALAAQIRTEKVFGRETPTGPYKHPASITELDNGDLYLVYYGGGGEYAEATAVFGSRRAKGAQSWTAPVKLAADPFRSLGNGVVWQGPDGVVWLFYVVRFGETWSDSRIAVKISRDRGATWSDASMLTLDRGMMVRNKPIVLAGGDYLLPVYLEKGDDPEFLGPDSASMFYRYSPRTKEWRLSGPIRSAKGNIQPAPVELEPGRLIAYCRRGGGYGKVNDGWLVRAESRDGGMTWSPGVNSGFPNPNAAVEFLKLRNGHLLLIYNDSMNSRTPLTAALSTDGDKTYAVKKHLAAGRGDYGYPSAVEGRDGTIHLVYTAEGRSAIFHAAFREEDLGR